MVMPRNERRSQAIPAESIANFAERRRSVTCHTECVTRARSSVTRAPSCHSLTSLPTTANIIHYMKWNVFIARHVPTESLDALRKAGANIDFHDSEDPLPRGEL